MTFRRKWLTALALTPVVFVVALMTVQTFPFVIDAFDLRCSGVGDSYRCPENEYFLAGTAYSAVLVTVGFAVVSMLFVVALTKRAERGLLAQDLHRLTIVVASVQVATGGVIAARIGGLFLLAGLLHLAATVLLFAALARSSRWLAIAACVLGIASVFWYVASPIIGALQTTTAGCFAILLIALLAPWGPTARPTMPNRLPQADEGRFGMDG